MRKLLGILLTAVMLCQLCLSAFATNEGDTPLAMEYSLLSELNIISADTEDFRGDTVVSRAQFSEFVGKMMTISPSFEMQYFQDVPKDLDQSGYINVLADCGIISLNDQRIFEPERPIRYAEACKMLLCAMGYSEYVKSKGNTMTHWVVAANEIGFSVSVADSNAIILSEASKMIFLAMQKPIMISNIVYKNNVADQVLTIDKNTNLFALYHDVYFDKGVVQATYGSYLERFSMPMEDEVVIGGSRFKTRYDFGAYLGAQVKYAYRYNPDGFSTVLYAQLTDETDVFEIPSALLEGYDEATDTFYYLTHEEAEKQNKKSVVRNKQIIYNGVPYNGSVTSAIAGFLEHTKRGSVVLTDSDNDGKFDIVIVKSCEIMPGASMDTVNENLYGGFSQTTLHYGNYQVVRLFDANGKVLEPDNYYDVVLQVAKSENNEVIEIIVCSDTKEFSVQSIPDSENKIEDASGNVYRVDHRIMSQYASHLLSYKSVKVYFDTFGYIVKIEPGTSADFMVGYLIHGISQDGPFGDVKVQFKLYTQNGKIETYGFSDKVVVDGITYGANREHSMMEALSSIPNSSVYTTTTGTSHYKIAPQIIRYQLNDDNQIKALDTTNFVASAEDTKHSLVVRHQNASMLNTNRVGLDTYWSSTETAVFQIPNLNAEGKILKNGSWVEPERKDFSNSISLNHDGTYTMDTYNFSDDDYYTDILVLRKDSRYLPTEAMIYLGTKQVWDSEQDATLTAVECYANGTKQTYKLNEGVGAQIRNQGIEVGDLFYITMDGSAQYVTELKKIFDANTTAFIHSSSNDYWYYGEYSPYSNWSYRTGEDYRNNLSKMYVLKKRGDAVFGSYEVAGLEFGTYEEIIRLGNISVMVVNTAEATVKKSNFNGILSYEDTGANASLILVESNGQVAKSVIIYQ